MNDLLILFQETAIFIIYNRETKNSIVYFYGTTSMDFPYISAAAFSSL